MILLRNLGLQPSVNTSNIASNIWGEMVRSYLGENGMKSGIASNIWPEGNSVKLFITNIIFGKTK